MNIRFKSYNEDSLIGTQVPDERIGLNMFTNVLYKYKRVEVGTRFESYFPPLLGYSPNNRFNGTGIGYRYIALGGESFHITVGNFYEQFGSGLVLRAYEEKSFGYDNVFDGFRVRWNLDNAIQIKALVGKQRYDFNGTVVNTDGYVRAVDVDIDMNKYLSSIENNGVQLTLGASVVSKFQKSNSLTLNIPQNVLSYATRGELAYKNISLFMEYAYKYNDPSADNNFIYRPGQVFLLNANYSKKGFAVILSAKGMDNMSFRSDRTLQSFDALINYLPALTKAHTYNLVATLYPYAVQLNGETSYQVDVIYKIPKKSMLGGKYGMLVSFNSSFTYGLDKEYLTGKLETDGYSTKLFSIGERYYRDINIEFKKKINKKVKMTLAYFNLFYNNDIIRGAFDNNSLEYKGNILSDIIVVEGLFKLKKRHALRVELQTLFTKQHLGNWLYFSVEYTVSPYWSFTILNQYNYGNLIEKYRLHHPYVSVSYIRHSTRVTVGYGRQRAGISCVGGVCNINPASNGLSLSLTSTF